MVNGVVTLFNVADDAVLIDHERDAVGKEAGKAKNAVGFGDLFVGVA
jgi:hypothetical protein